MGLFSELRLRARHIVGPVLGICAIGYFAFHAIRGDRGLLALRQLSQRVEIARLEYATIKSKRMQLEHKVRLLNPNSLDPDMLDERARIMLNYGFEDEVIIIPDVDVILTEEDEAK
jgi:cell division protein FtsB